MGHIDEDGSMLVPVDWIARSVGAQTLTEGAESINGEQMISALQTGETLVERVIQARERKLREMIRTFQNERDASKCNGSKSRKKFGRGFNDRSMPQVDWSNLPKGVRNHLADRVKDRSLSEDDMVRLTGWIKTNPEVPDGECSKDFGAFTLALLPTTGSRSRARVLLCMLPQLSALASSVVVVHS